MREILFLCVCIWVLMEGEATVDHSRITEFSYIEYIESLENDFVIISNFLPTDYMQVEDLRRHYVIFLGVLISLVEYLNLCDPVEYDRLYMPVLDKMVPIYWEHPMKVAEKFTNYSKNISNIVTPIKENVKLRCESLSNPTCNAVLEIIAHEVHLKVELVASILVLTNKLEKEFMKIETELIKAVSDYNEISLLIRGKKEFRPLVELASELYKNMFPVCLIDVTEL